MVQHQVFALMTRNGRDLADRFPSATGAIAELPARFCVIDSEGR